MIGEIEHDEGIEISVWHLSQEECTSGQKPGFYYSLDVEDDFDDATDSDVRTLRGPFASKEEALAAGEAFINDANDEHYEDADLDDYDDVDDEEIDLEDEDEEDEDEEEFA